MKRFFLTAGSVILAAAAVSCGFRYPCGPTAIGALLAMSFCIELFLAAVLELSMRLVKRGRKP